MPRMQNAHARGLVNESVAGIAASNNLPAAPLNPSFREWPSTFPRDHKARPWLSADPTSSNQFRS